MQVNTAKGKLSVGVPPDDTAKIISSAGCILLPIDLDTLQMACPIREQIDTHNDVFDHLILATAVQHMLPTLTSERIFSLYKNVTIISSRK